MHAAQLVPPDGGTSWEVSGDRITCKADLGLVAAHLQVFVVDGVRDAGPPPHSHPWDEVFAVLEGQLELLVGDDRQVVGPGWVAIAPAGTVHAFRTTSETSRFLAIASTELPAAFFADMHEHAPEVPPDPAKVVPIAIRHRLSPA